MKNRNTDLQFGADEWFRSRPIDEQKKWMEFWMAANREIFKVALKDHYKSNPVGAWGL